MVDLGNDTDTIVFHSLRVFRNAFIRYTRAKLGTVFGSGLDPELKMLFQKEWDEVERSAKLAHDAGFVERSPVDALDHLGVNQVSILLDKYWEYLCPHPNPLNDTNKKVRAHLLALARDLSGVRNPLSHAPQESLSLRDALRYIDSAVRMLDVLALPEASQLRRTWTALVSEQASQDAGPPALLDTLPSRELITIDFIGRAAELTDLWRWLGNDTRKIWALVGDGGKGKTTIAYEFVSQTRSALHEYGLQGVLWLTAKKSRYVEGETVATSSADFFDLDSALDWILTALGWSEDKGLDLDTKFDRCLGLLREFPMLIVADDIDSIDKTSERVVEFFALHVPQTASKVLLTSRREVFGLGGCTSVVSGMSEDEVLELVQRRASTIGIDMAKVGRPLVRQIVAATDGSPLYVEDLLRLAHFYSLEQALNEWSGRRGDPAREYALKRELEKLSKEAVSVLGVLAYSDNPLSLQECAIIVGLVDERAEAALSELRSWNLLIKPGLLEDVPRFGCSRNLGKLMRKTIEGTDLEDRIRNGLKGLRGVAFGSARVRQYIQQAVALKQRGSQVDAELTLHRGLDEVKNSGELHAMLGWLYSKWQPASRVTDAQENFVRAEALGSWSRDLYAHWADMELGHSEVRKAIEICERSLSSVARNDPFTWRLAGVAYTKLGQSLRQTLSIEQADDAFGKAEHALQRAQGLSTEAGDMSRALNARYKLARTTGSVQKAAAILEEWERLLPSDPYLSAVPRT